MVRIKDCVWVNKEKVKCICVERGEVNVYAEGDFIWEVDAEFIVDVLTAFNIPINIVLGKIGRSENEHCS